MDIWTKPRSYDSYSLKKEKKKRKESYVSFSYTFLFTWLPFAAYCSHDILLSRKIFLSSKIHEIYL